MRAPRCARNGFTLIEVLIALVILALALAAAARATSAAVDVSYALKGKLLATWVAQNRATEYQIYRYWPEPGEKTGNAEQGGIQFEWRETVTDTENKLIRRVQIEVFRAGASDHRMARLITYVANFS